MRCSLTPKAHISLLTALLLVPGCSSSDTPAADAGPTTTDTGPTAPDAAPLDQTIPSGDLAADAAAACSSTNVGGACSAGASDCFATSDEDGFCSLACTADRFASADNEDSCPEGWLCGAEQGLLDDGEGKGRCQEPVTNSAQGPACNKQGSLAPAPSDKPSLLASRLMPPGAFWVTGVRYALEPESMSTGSCDAGRAHKVRFLVGDAKAGPPSSPSYLETIEVPAKKDLTERRWLHLALSTPIKLEADQALFVVFEIAPSAGKATCLHLCAEPNPDAGAHSFATEDNTKPPLTWLNFMDEGWPGELTVALLGFPAG